MVLGLSNFAMGTILGKGFAQAQVLANHSTSSSAKPFPNIEYCPHGEVAFSNSDINKKNASFKSTMGKWHLMISFHHSRQIYYGEMMGLISFHHSRLLHTVIWQVFIL